MSPSCIIGPTAGVSQLRTLVGCCVSGGDSGGVPSHTYPEYMIKVMRIMNGSTLKPIEKLRSGVYSFGMHFDYARNDRIDLWNEVAHSVSEANPFKMRIYFVRVFR